jgi:hypothetical protein
MKKRSIKRRNTKRRVRGAPAFFKPEVSNTNQKDKIMIPETPEDVARLLKDEIKKKWPDAAGLPEIVSGKHAKLLKLILSEYLPETILDMVRVLVWDFDEIKKNKSFFPPCNHLNWPWIDQLYNYKPALAGAIMTGITDSTSRVSAYRQRYHSEASKAIDPAPSNDKPESSKDIAKRILGQG